MREADSVTFCLSKGLACPVGSLICGAREFIDRARLMRRMVGGGMRQSGVLAAAGVVALEEMVDRLADDHANARALAEGLAKFPQLKVDPNLAQTNILFATPGRHRRRQAAGRAEGTRRPVQRRASAACASSRTTASSAATSMRRWT